MDRLLALCMSPDQGGLELYFLKFVEFFQKKHDVFVACVENSYITKHISKNKIECRPNTHLNRILNFFKIRKFIIKNKINIIHISWSNDKFLAVLLKIFTPHKIKIILYRQMIISRPKRSIYHNFIYKRIDLFLVITKKLYDQACQYLPINNSKVHVLTYGIDKPSEETHISKKAFFSKHGMDPNIFTIGIFSRIEPEKGQHLVLEAVNQSVNKIQICIIGHSMDDDYIDQLRETADRYGLSKYLKVISFVKSPMSYMPCFDLIILPTHEETFGLVVAEAMLMGVPVIGSNAGGVPEIITHNHNGFLFQTKNSRDLKEKIDHVVENKQSLDTIINNGIMFANDEYDYHKHFETFETLIEGL
ncbi:MAG: hypothetical protein CMF41_00255 [Legionellales bacterium]|nr:hypothetical protein [Legionellales bacterium]